MVHLQEFKMFDVLSVVLVTFWFGLPFLAWLIRLVARLPIHGLMLFFVIVVCGYLSFVSASWTADIAARQNMDRFDLDGDGGISGSELTPQAQAAIDNWASDTGRAMAFITGIPLTIIWAAIWLIPLCTCEWLVRVLRKRGEGRGDVAEVAEVTADEANPYSAPESP